MQAHYSYLCDVRRNLRGSDGIIQRGEQFNRVGYTRCEIENEGAKIFEAFNGFREPAPYKVRNVLIAVLAAQFRKLGLDRTKTLDKVTGIGNPAGARFELAHHVPRCHAGLLAVGAYAGISAGA